MDIFKIKTRKDMDSSVEFSGNVTRSYLAHRGFWLNIKDKTGNIFVFSRYDHALNELLKIKGTVKSDNRGSVCIYSDRIHKAFQRRKAVKFILPIQTTNSAQIPERDEKFEINKKKFIIISLIAIIVCVGILFFVLYGISTKEKKSEMQSFLESVNDDFTKTLQSCIKTRNSEKRDICLYRIAPYAVKKDLSQAIDICNMINDISEGSKCLNFLSMYMSKRDINSSIDVCDSINDSASRDNCILGLVPHLFQQDTNKTLELCNQFDIILKDDCFYSIASGQADLEESKIYCEMISNLIKRDLCLSSFEMRNMTVA